VIDPGIIQGFEIAESLTPLVIGLVKGLVEAGHSPEAAAAIVKRDIASLKAKYEQQKAEDRAALERKHGRSTDPEFEEP
jgi:hypothetical protein